MSFPEKTLHTLEFDKVREMLAACALTQGAADRARALVPYDDEELVLRYQRLTTDARRLAEAKGMPSFGAVKDVTGACERADNTVHKRTSGRRRYSAHGARTFGLLSRKPSV